MLKFIRRKRRKTGLDKAEEESERVDAVDYFTRKLTYLLQVLVSAYYDSMLKWYEQLIIVVGGVLLGVGGERLVVSDLNGFDIVRYGEFSLFVETDYRPDATVVIYDNESDTRQIGAGERVLWLRLGSGASSVQCVRYGHAVRGFKPHTRWRHVYD